MKVQSVRKKRQPAYPTLEHFIQNPQQLSSSVPQRWLKNTHTAMLLSAFVLCGTSRAAAKDVPPATAVIPDNKPAKPDQPVAAKPTVAKAAPVFVHGTGRGSIGCVVGAPPVFLAEDEALQVISALLGKEGFQLKTNDVPSVKITIPDYWDILDDIETASFEEMDDGNARVTPKRLDAYDADRRLAVEFVSVEDCRTLVPRDIGSKESFMPKAVARLLQKNMVQDGKLFAAVFYDPLTSRLTYTKKEDGKYVASSSKEKSIADLTAQVEDFIRWMRANQEK